MIQPFHRNKTIKDMECLVCDNSFYILLDEDSNDIKFCPKCGCKTIKESHYLNRDVSNIKEGSKTLEELVLYVFESMKDHALSFTGLVNGYKHTAVYSEKVLLSKLLPLQLSEEIKANIGKQMFECAQNLRISDYFRIVVNGSKVEFSIL